MFPSSTSALVVLLYMPDYHHGTFWETNRWLQLRLNAVVCVGSIAFHIRLLWMVMQYWVFPGISLPNWFGHGLHNGSTSTCGNLDTSVWYHGLMLWSRRGTLHCNVLSVLLQRVLSLAHCVGCGQVATFKNICSQENLFVSQVLSTEKWQAVNS